MIGLLGRSLHRMAMQAAEPSQQSVRPCAHSDPPVLDIVTMLAAAPDFEHVAKVTQLQQRAEAAEARAAAADEARSIAEEALQRLSDCNARWNTY
jgi:regulator of protease activity HflC (stomatin/prohibitin superfamily)